MAGLRLAPLPPPGNFRVWEKDRPQVEREIVEGRPFQVFDTERGRFDAMFDFMLRSGLWEAATAMRPAGLKKDHGTPYRLLNGVECLREMAGMDTPANCGPLLKDPYLLTRIGFTAEEIASRLAQGRGVIDTETLWNHLGRFTEKDLEAGFPEHLKAIRHKRWLRGGVYAVDGHDIVIPYGKGYEGARRIGDGAYGYKLLVLLNIQEDCELIVGYILGGLQESEITMLRRLLARLDQTIGPLREWLKILLMDRGYWGTDLFCELQQDYGIDFVSRVRDQKMDLNGSIQRQLEEADRDWSEFEEPRQFSGRQETQRVRVTALRPIALIGDEAPEHRQIDVNVVVAVQSHGDGSPILDKNGKDINRLRDQPEAGEARGESARLLSGPLGNRESGLSLALADLGDRPSGPAQLSSGAGAAGVRVPNLQRAPLVRKAKPSPPRLCRATAADALVRSGDQFGGSDDHRVDGLRLLLRADGAGVAETAKATPAEDERGMAAGKSLKEVMQEIDNS